MVALSGGRKAVCRNLPAGSEHKGYDCRELVTLKSPQSEYPDILPVFYMDKRNCISVYLDGNLPQDVLFFFNTKPEALDTPRNRGRRGPPKGGIGPDYD